MALDWIVQKYEQETRILQQAQEDRLYFTARTTGINDDLYTIVNAFPKIAPYAQHPTQSQLLVAEVFSRRIKGENIHDIEVRYSTEVDVALNPLAAPAQVLINTQLRQVPAIWDTNGFAVTNTAGDLFTEPAATRNLVDCVIQVSKNVPLVLPDWIQTHPGTVNNDTVQYRRKPWAQETLFFAAMSIGPEINVPGAVGTVSTLSWKSTPYTTIDFELWWHRDGWTSIFPNRGYFQLVPKPGGQKFQPAEVPGSKQGISAQQMRARFNKLPPYTRQRITVGPLADFPPDPVFLDANGAAIVNPTLDDVIFLEFDFNDKRAFSVLPR